MTVTDQVIESLRSLLTRIQKRQENEKNQTEIRSALQAFEDNIQRLLTQFIQKPNNHEWILLFCRRAERLPLKYRYVNEPEWKRRREAIDYLLTTNVAQIVHSNNPTWTRFLTLMNFEQELQKRAILSTRITISKTYYSKRLVQNYLLKCIALHSKIRVHGLNIIMKELLGRLFLYVEETNPTREQKIFLEEKVGPFDIPLNCSHRNFQIISKDNIPQTASTSRIFIPSINTSKHRNIGIRSLKRILRTNRWIMLLGAPGTGKTLLLRWLTLQYACSALEGFKEVYLNDAELEPVRIPILIRLDEFAEWLIRKPEATLFDYIGHQAWFGERYMPEECEGALKCAVLQGQALILLDGLNEVLTTKYQAQIQRLIIEFISEHVRSDSHVSAFDDTVLVHAEDEYTEEVNKANQIIITSRLMEYFLHPWKSEAIKHYSLSTLTTDESIDFINHWISQVENKIIQRANIIGIAFEKCQRRKIFCTSVLETLQKLLDTGNNDSIELTLEEIWWNKTYQSEHLLSVPMILSVICSVILNKSLLPNNKGSLYHTCMDSLLPVWISSCKMSSTLSQNILTRILSHLAYYLHKKSPSGLIDEFDLKHLCYVSLKTIDTNHALSVPIRLVLESQVETLMKILKSDVSIIATSSFAVYGFVHLIFQEYFVAAALMESFGETKDYNNISANISSLVVQLVQHTVIPRFREPLILTLSSASSRLFPTNFDSLCYELITLKKSPIPFGALLLLEALGDLVTLPSKDIIFEAFHSILILDCNSIFDSILRRTLLNVLLAKNWLVNYLSCESNIQPFCKLILRLFEIPKTTIDDLSEDTIWGEETKLSLPKWITSSFTQQLHDLLYIFPNTEYTVDQTLRRINMLQDGSLCMCKNSLQNYLLERKVAIWRLHPIILTLIIAIYGGLFRYRGDDELWVKFHPQCMYRNSVLSPMLIDYLNEDNNNGHIEKLRQLIMACEERLKIISFSDVTTDAVDLIIALVCLRGLEKRSKFLNYSAYAAFPIAIRRFKRILFYLRQTFVCIKRQASLFSKVIHAVMTEFCDLSKRNDQDIVEFLEATIIGYTRLTATTKPIILRKLIWPRARSAFALLPLKLSNIELTDFLVRAPSIIRLLCSNPLNSICTSSFKEMLKVLFNKAPLSVLFAFVPHSLQHLYERLISRDLLKNHDADKDSNVFTDKNDRKLPFAFFLYQVLRHLETKINYHLTLFVLSLFEPFLINHGFTSYIIAFLADLKNEKSFDFKYYVNYAELSTSNRVQTAINEEQHRIECMVKVEKQQHLDEQLFISAVCLMRLCRKFRANEIFDDVCRAVFAIQSIPFRALAVTAIWHLTYQSQLKISLRNTLSNAMSLCFESLTTDVPLLITSLILAHTGLMKHAFPELFKLQLNEILQALNGYSLCLDDIRAIYMALPRNTVDSFIPSPTLMHCQVRPSVAIARCFTDDQLWSSNRHSGKTLLFSALYLIELAVDVQILRYCCESQDLEMCSPSPRYLSGVSLGYSESLALIDKYQKNNSALVTLDDAQLKTISMQLCHGTYMIVEVQQLVKHLKNHFRLFLFVQRDCLSFIEKDIFAPLFIEVLCASLESSDDQIREQLQNLFEHPLLFPFDHDYLHILMNNASYYINNSSLHYASMLYNRIKISRLEDLHAILQLEYDRIHTQSIAQCDNRRLSFLRLVGQCEKDVLNYYIQYINSLILPLNNSTNIKTIYLEHIITLIYHGVEFVTQRYRNTLESLTLFSEDTTYREFLIHLLKTCQVSAVQESVAQVLAETVQPVCCLPNDEFSKQMVIVHEVFWEIIRTAAMDNQRDLYTNNLLLICLCSLSYRYVRQSAPLYTPDESTETILINLHRNHKSPDVQNRAHCLLNLYYLDVYGEENFLEHCNMDAEVAYRLLMCNLQNQYEHFFHRPHLEQKISSLIRAHPEKLFSLFVNDFKSYMTLNESLNLRESHPPYARIAAKLIQSDSLKHYCEAVRTNALGELGFMRALRSASKNWTSHCQTEVLIIAIAFGVLTMDLVDFILEVALRLSGVNTNQDFVTLISEVSERKVIEYIIANLRASSMIQRYLMGEILVHLALIDIVSPFEITNELLDTINDSNSQRILQHTSFGPNVTLGEEIARLLKRLICILPPITPTREFSHFISQKDIDHDFSVALNAFNDAFCSLLNETDNSN